MGVNGITIPQSNHPATLDGYLRDRRHGFTTHRLAGQYLRHAALQVQPMVKNHLRAIQRDQVIPSRLVEVRIDPRAHQNLYRCRLAR